MTMRVGGRRPRFSRLRSWTLQGACTPLQNLKKKRDCSRCHSSFSLSVGTSRRETWEGAREVESASYAARLRSKRVTKTKERLLHSLWFSTSLRGRRRLGFLLAFLDHAKGTRQGEGGSPFHPACARAFSVEISPFVLNDLCLLCR